MTTTTTPNKTVGTALFNAEVANVTMTAGTEVDVSAKFSGTAFIRLGRTVTTALTNPVGFKLEASAKASGNDFWVPLYTWANSILAVTGIIPASNLLMGATSAGATTYVLDGATGQNAGDLVFFYEANTWEWARTKSVATATATPLDHLVYAHADNCIVLDQSEEWAIQLDLTSYKRIRLVVDTAAAGGVATAPAGYAVYVQAFLNTFDSASTA